MVHTSGAAIALRERFISFLQRGGGTIPTSERTRYDRVIRVISAGVVLMTETMRLRQGSRSRWYTATSVWRNRSDEWQVVYGHNALMSEGTLETPELLKSYEGITGPLWRVGRTD